VYHRAAAGRAWWRSLVELVLVVVLWFVAVTIVVAIAMASAQVKKLEELDNSSNLLLLLAMMAMLVPACLLAARIVGRKPGMLSSVIGRLRKRWLVRCLLLAVVANVVWIAALVLLNAVLGHHGTSHASAQAAATNDTEGLGQFLVFVVLLVPIQAAGEEYFFRGTLMQVIGRFFRPWPIAAVVSTIAFTAAHGTLSVASTQIVAMGGVLAWLTVRTGGLEVGIGHHVVNNLIVFVVRALADGGDSIDSKHLNEGATWSGVIGQALGLAVYAALVLRSWKKSPERVATRADQVEQHAPERGTGVEHADHGGDAQALAPQQQEPRG
jgi:membrane protease YdiL (CAAX protease family)